MNTNYLKTFFIPLALCSTALMGQDADEQARKAMNAATLADGISSSEIALYAKPPAEPDIEGTPYMNDHWSFGSFMVNKDKVYDVKELKYNIKDDYLEFKLPEGTRILRGSSVYRFSIYDKGLKNFGRCSELLTNDETGFCEILAEDPALLLKRTQIIIKQPNYNTALMSGSKSKRIIQSEEYFLKDKRSSTYTHLKKRKDWNSFFEKIGLKSSNPDGVVDLDNDESLINYTYKVLRQPINITIPIHNFGHVLIATPPKAQSVLRMLYAPLQIYFLR